MKQWGQVTTAQKGEKDPNILTLGDSTKLRPLDLGVAAWEQHSIENPEDDQQVTFVTCPGRRVCPLDKKPSSPAGVQYFPRSKRFACNVWSYGDNAVKVLIAGPQV